MTTAINLKSAFQKWQDGINKAVGDAKWNVYDCEIQMAVDEFNLYWRFDLTSGMEKQAHDRHREDDPILQYSCRHRVPTNAHG